MVKKMHTKPLNPWVVGVMSYGPWLMAIFGVWAILWGAEAA